MAFVKRIVGIDAGYVNFAICGLSTDKPTQPYYWVNKPLFKGEFSEEKLVHAVHHWINTPEIKELLAGADEIILERQMAMKFQAINHCVRFNYFDKTREVNPNSIRSFFGLPAQRREKKKAAVALVGDHAIFPVKTGKKDDLADAYLLAMSAAMEYLPGLKQGWEIPNKKIKV